MNLKKINDKSKNKETILTLCCIVILFGLCLRNIRISNGPYVFNDELGYLGNAAALAGKDWHYAMQRSLWYSYGWSIIISPLFLLFSNMEIIYRAIIIMNALMVVGVFLLQRNLLTNIFKNIGKTFATLFSACSCCYVSVLYNTSISWPETFLLFMYTVMTYFFYYMLKNPKPYKSAIWAFLLVYFYVIHNRMICVVLVGIAVYMICLICRKVNIRGFILFIGTLGISFFLFDLLKRYIVSLNWRGGLPHGNDMYTGLEVLKNLFMSQGITNFFGLLCSESIYVIVSSFGLVPLGIHALVSKSLASIKNKDYKFAILSAWLAFAFFGMFALNCINFSYGNISSKRVDHLFYGRYFEPLYIFLIAIGLYYLKFEQKPSRILLTVFISVTAIASIFAFNLSGMLKTNIFNVSCSSGIYIFYEKFSDAQYFIFPAIMIAFVTLNLLDILFKSSKKVLNYFGCCLCVAAFMANLSSSDQSIINYQKIRLHNYLPIIRTVNSTLNQEDKLYVVDADPLGFASSCQCMLPEMTIIPINDAEDIHDDEYYIILSESGLVEYALSYQTDIIISHAGYAFIHSSRLKQNEHTFNLPLNKLHLKDGTCLTENDEICVPSSETGHLAFYGPYMPLKEGNYKFDFEMDISGEFYSETLGTIQVYSNSKQKIYSSVNITPQMAANGNIKMVLQLTEDLNDMEIYLKTQSGISYLVKSINISQPNEFE